MILGFHLSTTDGFFMSQSPNWILLILCGSLSFFIYNSMPTANIAGGCFPHLLFMCEFMESCVYIKQVHSALCLSELAELLRAPPSVSDVLLLSSELHRRFCVFASLGIAADLLVYGPR